ncbi:MAG TPA: hypothetical protein VHT21_15950 [Stellaceae bacterium]|nr:hypothetical protein [Stellaceae bacterium]
MAAGRLFAECGRELIGIHEVLALGGQGAQHFKGRGRQAATPQVKPLGGVEGAGGTSPAALRPSAVAVNQAIALGDIAERAQIHAPGIKNCRRST